MGFTEMYQVFGGTVKKWVAKGVAMLCMELSVSSGGYSLFGRKLLRYAGPFTMNLTSFCGKGEFDPIPCPQMIF